MLLCSWNWMIMGITRYSWISSSTHLTFPNHALASASPWTKPWSIVVWLQLESTSVVCFPLSTHWCGMSISLMWFAPPRSGAVSSTLGIQITAPTSIRQHWFWKCSGSPQCQHTGPGFTPTSVARYSLTCRDEEDTGGERRGGPDRLVGPCFQEQDGGEHEKGRKRKKRSPDMPGAP